MRNAVNMLVFLFFSASIFVFFSEKAYFYAQGYVYFELVLYYLLPSFFFLWSLDVFKVRGLSDLFISASIYGLLVEGVLANIIYEGGLFAVFSISYTSLAWHAPISIVFGYYLIRKWLIHGEKLKLLLGNIVFGLFWGTWSLTLWLPEFAEDVNQATNTANSGIWSVEQFAGYAFFITIILIVSHWLLDKVWIKSFKPTKWMYRIFIILISIYFILNIQLQIPYAILKLGLLLILCYGVLFINKNNDNKDTILNALSGNIKPFNLLFIIIMPIVATTVYGIAFHFQLSQTIIENIFYLTYVFVQSLSGFVFFLISIGAIIYKLKCRQ